MVARKTQGYIESYITRHIPRWGSPEWMNGVLWRRVVQSQMLAMVCRDTLIMQILQLRWDIRAREQAKASESKELIKHYRELFLEGDGEGYDTMLDLLLQDVLDIPFGGMIETQGSNGRVERLYNVDGATLYPTYDEEFPVAQIVTGIAHEPILLKRGEFQRIYLTPRTNIHRKGWGMPPPERIYLALELLIRGDQYYANLLLDTPAAGILDLVDMEQESAIEWVHSYRELLVGPEAFKVPVLYEHEKPAVWIPFNLKPNELVFNETTLKYAAITCAGYGMLPSDIGLKSEGRSLAGSIREERRSRRLGIGMLMARIKYTFDRILPEELEWVFVEDDEETLLAKGRARLTNARAMKEYVSAGILLPRHALEQTQADGLITVHVDPAELEEMEREKKEEEAERDLQEHHLIGNPVPPSQGGHGQIKPDTGRQGPP